MRNYYNQTLLHYAASHNSTSCLRVLLRFAPHLVDAVDADNYTSLLYAVMHDKRDVVKRLLRAGADVRKKDLDRTMFDWVRLFKRKEMLEILKQYQQV